MNKKKRDLIAYSVLGSVLVVVDRITKWYACSYGSDNSCSVVFNRGVTWGLFSSADYWLFWLLTVSIMCVTLIVTWYAVKRWRQGKLILGEICIIAGSFSNIIDRFIYGGVLDFIHLTYHGYSWPLFNYADVAIVIGVGIMFGTHLIDEI